MAIGNPISLTNNIAEKTSSQIAAANQAQFIVSGGYLVNKLGVYRNGVKLSQSSDYTANDGDTVNLVVPANDGDVIQFQVFDYFNIADAITTEGGTVAGTLTVEGSIVANGGVTGDLTGDVTGDISGATATFTGDVSIGGTLTYEDVTNIDSVGIITARSDISIADKIVHTGDTDTAIRFPNNNTFTVETAGSERVRVESGGDVGIGTNDPNRKLHVQGSFGLSGRAHIGDVNQSTSNLRDIQTTVNRSPKVQINEDSGPGSGLALITWHSSISGYYSPHLWLAKSNASDNTVGTNTLVTNGTDLGTINFAGNDGATFLNAASIRGEVDGTAATDDMPGRLVFYTTGVGSSEPSEQMRINSSGNVGIGTDSPGYMLDVTEDATDTIVGRFNNTGNTSAYMTVQASGTTLGAVRFGATGDQMSLWTGSSESMRIDSNGNVGINTSSPNSKLHISGNSSDSAALSDTVGDYALKFDSAITSNYFSNAICFAEGTNVNASIASFDDGSGGVQGLVFGTGASNVERMRIDSDGNVGIATVDPTEKLHVIGNILASGNITAFSDIKLKDNIEVIPNALDKVVQIRGVTFDRIDEEVPRQSGVIAQEVEKVLPEVVITNKDGIKSVAYGNLVGLLIESIKELKVEVNELKARLEE